MAELSAEINIEKLETIKNIKFTSDVDFKSALKDVLGHSAAGNFESEILPKAIE
ncbi:MAG: hypothetical protein R2764_02020 [Bacteroidales bacterium]